jgi:hypothetical protein
VYAEGRASDGSGYSAHPEVSLPGVERAMADIDSAVTWLKSRSDVDQVNVPTLRRGAAFKNPSFWLYANQDPYYRANHSRKNFDSFTAAGGIGSFKPIPVQPKQNGHFIASEPGLWGEKLDQYLATLNL